MITAINKYKTKILAFSSFKEDGPFYCSSCGEEVILKKGEVKLHHFAHKASSNCIHSGESFLHESSKIEIFNYLNGHSSFKNTELEKVLDSSRADVYTEQEDKRIAIEVQVSTLTREKLKERTKKYTDKNIFVLWVIPYEALAVNKDWQKYIKSLYFGNIYVWKNKKLIALNKFGEKEVKFEYMKFIKRDNFMNIQKAWILLHFEFKRKESFAIRFINIVTSLLKGRIFSRV